MSGPGIRRLSSGFGYTSTHWRQEQICIGHLNLGKCLIACKRMDEARDNLTTELEAAEHLGAEPLIQAAKSFLEELAKESEAGDSHDTPAETTQTAV